MPRARIGAGAGPAGHQEREAGVGPGGAEIAALPRAVAAVLGDHLPPSPAEAGEAPEGPRLQAQLEALLTEHEGNVAEVARAMGKARMQVHRWMKRYSISVEEYRD